MQAHGGYVEAQSTGGGQGSTFTVTLPITDPGRDLPLGPGAQPDEGGRSAKKIVIVDDNEDGAESLAALLKLLGLAWGNKATANFPAQPDAMGTWLSR